MRSKISTITLWILSIVSIFMVLKTSDEPMLAVFKDTWVNSIFQQIGIGDSILFNLSIGFIISVIFYLLVVWFPDRQRKKLMKRNIEIQYKMFKQDMVDIFLSIINFSHKYDLPSKLLDVKEFRDFFNEPYIEDQSRFDGVLNGLDEYYLNRLLVILGIFRDEVAFVLNNVNIKDPETFDFLKRLSHFVYSLKNSSFKGDEIKEFESFVWQLFGGFSLAEGCKDNDIVEIMIKKI